MGVARKLSEAEILRVEYVGGLTQQSGIDKDRRGSNKVAAIIKRG